MMVIDEVDGSDEGELEDGEIEEEEGQIVANLPEDSDFESPPEKHGLKNSSSRSKQGDLKEFNRKRERETATQSQLSESRSQRTSPTERNKNVDPTWKVRTNSASPKRGERERNRSVSGSGKSRAQKRANEAVRRARRRESPGRRSSGSGVKMRTSGSECTSCSIIMPTHRDS